MSHLRVRETADIAEIHSSIAKSVKKTGKDQPFSQVLGEELSKADPSAQRNTIENICKWCADPERYPEPDDEALIDALYNDDLRDYSSADKPRIGYRWVVCQKNPDGSLFYYPPRDASFEEKREFVNAMKGLSCEERYQVNNLIADKFGFSPFHSFLQRQSRGVASDVNSDTLFNLLHEEVIKDLMKMRAEDTNRPWREAEATLLEKLLARRGDIKHSALK